MFKEFVLLTEMILQESDEGAVSVIKMSEGVFDDAFIKFNDLGGLNEAFKPGTANDFANKNNARWITSGDGHKLCVTKGKDSTIISGRFKGTKLKDLKAAAQDYIAKAKKNTKNNIKYRFDVDKDTDIDSGKMAPGKFDWQNSKHSRDMFALNGLDIRHIKGLEKDTIKKLKDHAKKQDKKFRNDEISASEMRDEQAKYAKAVNRHMNKVKGTKDQTANLIKQHVSDHKFERIKKNSDRMKDAVRDAQKDVEKTKNDYHLGKRTKKYFDDVYFSDKNTSQKKKDLAYTFRSKDFDHREAKKRLASRNDDHHSTL